MRAKLLHGWPILPALLILYLGGERFINKYPKPSHRSKSASANLKTTDSLLAFILKERDIDSLAEKDEKDEKEMQDSTAATKNPFRSPNAGIGTRNALPASPKSLPPARKYVLKGTVGAQVATIEDAAGQKHIVKVGDRVDSAVVQTIESNKVILKDRAGKFELLQEP